MKKAIYLFMFIIFLTIPTIVKADSTYYSCNASDLTKLQKLATNIVSSYDYQENFGNNKYGSVTFTIKLTNLNSKLYIINTGTKTRYNYSSNELVINNISPGQTLHYEVYGNDYGCNDKYLMTIYINIPSYNKYYVDDLCKNFQGYKLCNKWNKVDMSYDEFKNAVSKYANAEKPNNQEDEKNDKTFEEIFIEIVAYLDKNKMPIFGTTVIISALLIIYLKYIDNKNKFKLK